MGHKIIVLEITDEHYNNLLAHIAQNGNILDTDAVDLGENTPAPVGAPSVDNRGVPWHANFHAPSKSIIKDGSFRRIKGVDKAAADAYEAPFIAASAATPATAPAAVAASAPAMPGLPGLPTPAPVLQMPVAAPAPAPVDYPTVVALFGEKLQTGKITNDQIGAIYAEAGVDANNTAALQTDETLRAKLAGVLNRFV